jgi:iron complex outermembrane receptor protein
MTIRRLRAFSPLPMNTPATLQRLALLASVLAAASLAPAVYAQSSGTLATEEELAEVTVTAQRQVINFSGVTEQNAPKSRITVTADYLDTQTAGQTVFQSINMVPGVNFTNNDAYGSSGGNLRIRSFDGSRVSVTFDGLPLNDSGNYALFTNQMLDPELVDRIDINLGTNDVDSPTASATGGTVAYRSIRPSREFGGRVVLSGGSESYKRGFGLLNFGEFGPWKTTAWIAGSYAQYDKFKGPGELKKRQFNALLRQDFDNGNWFFVAFHLNKNRNNFFRTTSDPNYQSFGRGYDNLATCTLDAPTAGTRDNDNATPVANTPTLLAADNILNTSSCGNYYNVRINPSDTANIRAQSLWHLSDKVILTLDPSMQYTLANGGGTSIIDETPAATAFDRRIVGAATVAGFDINGDGDILDNIRVYSPNTTNTYRLGVTSSLIWNVSENHRLRFAYTLDRARHRQTGQNGPLLANGDPENVFAGWSGLNIRTADGSEIRGRDRYSIAQNNQIAAEYRGEFMDDKVTATVGVTSKDFKRELNQYCYSLNGGTGNSGQLLCTTQTNGVLLANGNYRFGASTTEFIAPYSRTVKFDDVLPNVGLTFKLWDGHTFYLSYAEALSAPRTDNLYAVRRQPDGSVGSRLPESESTKSYDIGWRLSRDNVLASVALWRSDYSNRIVSAFDQDLGFNVDRNVGAVKLRGIDAQVGWKPVEQLTFSFSASYNKSELQEDLPSSATLTLSLKGKTLVETPKLTFASRADWKVMEGLRVGLQAKHVDKRFSTDLNNEATPAYTVVDLDASYQFSNPGWDWLKLKLNVSNAFDEKYYGNISSGTGFNSNNAADRLSLVNNPNLGFFQIGSPRAVILAMEAKF